MNLNGLHTKNFRYFYGDFIIFLEAYSVKKINFNFKLEVFFPSPDKIVLAKKNSSATARYTRKALEGSAENDQISVIHGDIIRFKEILREKR